MSRASRAEYHPAFDMDSCVGGAELIVSGYLDPSDRITVTETFAGEPGGRTIELGEWGRRFRSLTQPDRWWQEPPAWKRAWRWIMGPPRVEVVAFFPRKIGTTWTLGGETWNLVLLSGDAVYPFDGSGYNSPQPLYGRTQFLAALREAIQAKAERTRLLASPRTIERTKELIRLAQRHDHLPGSPDGFWFTPFYHLAEIAKGLAQPSAEEEDLLLRVLANTPTEAQKVKILRLITLIPLKGRAAFDEIIPYLERGQPAEIRRSAMRALGAVDSFRAVDAFGPLLTGSEPELQTVLESLRLNPETNWNPTIVDHLLRLADEFRTDVPTQGDTVLDYRVSNQLSRLGGLFRQLGHPRLLPMLVDCSQSKKQFSPGDARNILAEITHLDLPSEDGKKWQRWWKSVRGFLEPDYNLHTEAGRAAWIAGWSAGDAATRRVLVNLWRFEPELEPAKALLEQAPTSGATMALLSELWNHKRLTPEVEKAIVEQYLRLEQKSADRDIALFADSGFSFPPTVSVHVRDGWAIGDVEEMPRWEDSDIVMLANLPGRRFPARTAKHAGAPIARHVLEIGCMDYWPQRKVRWTVAWHLEPVPLGDLAR